MPDWPTTYVQPQPTILGSFGPTSLAADCILASPTANIGSGAWPATNLALYLPVWTEIGVLAQKMAVWVTVQSGNLDVGIYTETGTRLVSMGSTSVAVAGLQTFDIADTWLDPGSYYLAMCVDNTTAAFERTANIDGGLLRASGCRQQAVGAVTLPATATFANISNSYLPGLSAQCGAVI